MIETELSAHIKPVVAKRIGLLRPHDLKDSEGK